MTTLPDQTSALPASLRANRDFQLVLAGQAVSAFGDAITMTAMPLLVLFLTGSGVLMGLVGALQVLPDLVLGLPAGALADRWDRRKMMLWADAGRALLTAVIPLSAWLAWPTLAVILIVTVPINALRVLSDAGFTSAVPGLVGRENLARANSYMEATLSVPFIVGPALAGVLVATIGAEATIAIDAASFAISAASLLLVRRVLRAERPREMPRMLVDIKQGLGFVWRHVGLRMVISYWTLIFMAVPALSLALASYIVVDLRDGPELFGFVGSTWSIGYLLGSLLSGRLSGIGLSLRMLASGVVLGASLVAIALASLVPLYLAISFCGGAALAVQSVSYMTLRPLLTPDELLGRVGSTARMLSAGLRPLGLLAGGALIDLASGGAALVVLGGFLIGVNVLFGLSRTFREAGRGAD